VSAYPFLARTWGWMKKIMQGFEPHELSDGGCEMDVASQAVPKL